MYPRLASLNLQVGLGGADKGGELALVLTLHVLEGQNGSSLLVNDRAKTSLALDDHVRDTHLAAKSGEEDDELDGVNIMRDDNQRRLLGLDKSDGVVQTILDEQGLLRVLDHALIIQDT